MGGGGAARSTRPVRRRVEAPESFWPFVRRYRSTTRGVVGQLSADLFDGGTDPDRNASVAKLGGSVLGRLIVVSNRVALPSRDGGAQAGGLAIPIRAVLGHRPGVWFGWSGRVAPEQTVSTNELRQNGLAYVVTDLAQEDYDEYYN